MKKSKLKTLLILLIILIVAIAFGAGTYAGYVLSAKDITYTKSDGTTISVKEALDELNTKIPEGATVTASTATTHTAKAIAYSWDELSNIAQSISNNSSITNDTVEVIVLNGTVDTIGVGDTITLGSKTVRILGFNHDELASSTAYGEETATGKAGISFEYVDLLISSASMNSNDTTSGGWESCALRTTLNGTTYSGLSIKDKIKQVKKEYIKIWSDPSSKTTSSDYLWLLSCGEIWDNGYDGGVTRGEARGTEGSQYKYYKSTLGSTSWDSDTDYTKKPNTSNSKIWWLRSPYWNGRGVFCTVFPQGYCNGKLASVSIGVAPGFCI